jgi:hypothetical protein
LWSGHLSIKRNCWFCGNGQSSNSRCINFRRSPDLQLHPTASLAALCIAPHLRAVVATRSKVERDISESASRLSRYLEYNAIISGKAIEAAREDYRNASRDRLMKATLPKAWVRLVEEEDELLLEFVAERVESLCGYKPDLDAVARFPKENISLRTDGSSPPPPRLPAPQPLVVFPGNLPRSVGFVLNGQYYLARNASNVLVLVFETLSQRDRTFLERCAALPKHGRTRRYLARSPEDLYLGRPDLCHEYSVQLSTGWWPGTNLSRA